MKIIFIYRRRWSKQSIQLMYTHNLNNCKMKINFNILVLRNYDMGYNFSSFLIFHWNSGQILSHFELNKSGKEDN
jgi:hypothetical protein